jgi:HAMP domain-containing protein
MKEKWITREEALEIWPMADTAGLVERLRHPSIVPMNKGVALCKEAASALEQAQARIAELEKERDRWKGYEQKRTADLEATHQQLCKAQASIERLEGALREMADYAEREYREGEKEFQFSIIARAALKEQ